MNIIEMVRAFFNATDVVVDENTGFASSHNGQPCNAWTFIVNGKPFDVWTSVSGSVLLALPA